MYHRPPMELKDLVQIYNSSQNNKSSNGIGGHNKNSNDNNCYPNTLSGSGTGVECDYGFKLIIIGDAGAGKSSFMHQFLEGKFRKTSTHTIGVEFGTKIISLDGRNIKLQIWDTAGQERYRAVTRSYYRGSVGALILYDVTSRESFNNLPTWLRDAREQASFHDISVIAVGNKRDLKEERQVSFLEASNLARENDILFLEVSALSGENVAEAFHTLSARILNKVEEGVKNGPQGYGGEGLGHSGRRGKNDRNYGKGSRRNSDEQGEGDIDDDDDEDYSSLKELASRRNGGQAGGGICRCVTPNCAAA